MRSATNPKPELDTARFAILNKPLFIACWLLPLFTDRTKRRPVHRSADAKKFRKPVPITGRSSSNVACRIHWGLNRTGKSTPAPMSISTQTTLPIMEGSLRQQPLAGIEGHPSYSLTEKFWASLDTCIAPQAVNTAYFGRLQINRGPSRPVGAANGEQVLAFMGQ